RRCNAGEQVVTVSVGSSFFVRPARALHETQRGFIRRRMPRMQVYLPDGMYQQVKARGLPVSELLQKAVQAELRRLDLLAETEASARVQPLTVCFSARSERGLKPATTLRSKRTGE